MESVSTRLDTETVRLVRETAAERDVSMAEVLRDLVEKGLEYDNLEAERDDLRRQLREVNRQERDVGELVEYVEEERALQRRARERQDAPAWQRAKWWVFGRE